MCHLGDEGDEGDDDKSDEGEAFSCTDASNECTRRIGMGCALLPSEQGLVGFNLEFLDSSGVSRSGEVRAKGQHYRNVLLPSRGMPEDIA